MTHITEALPELVAAVMTLASLAAIVLLLRTRRSYKALRAARDTTHGERDRALAERDRALAERDRALADQEAAHQETARINSGRTALLEETQHLVSTRMPALVTHLSHQHVPVPGLKHQPFSGTEVEQLHRSVLEQLSKAVAEERERVDESAQAVMRGATTVIQAQSYQLQSKVEAMQHRYDSPDLAEDLLELDLLNEQNLRRIQATGVLCGATPGLTRLDSHLGDVVVGAQSRVRGYRRVHVTSQLTDPVGVVARAVEPIAITVSELLANAVHHSHGTLAVDVSLHQVESGACVVIDDAGVGMHADEIEFAQRMLSGRDALRLSELGDPPRSGFATIGRLVRQHGFSVSVDKPAAYGGVRAVVLIPGNLLTLLDEDQRPMSAMTPQSQAAGRLLNQPYAVSDFQTPGHAEPPPVAPPTVAQMRTPAPEIIEPPRQWEGPDVKSDPADEPLVREPRPVEEQQTPPADGQVPDGLPRRRRRRAQAEQDTAANDPTNTAAGNPSSRGEEGLTAHATAPYAAPQETPSAAVTEPRTTPEETGATWSAFQAGTESGRAAAHTPPPQARPEAAQDPSAHTRSQAHSDTPEGSN